MRSQIMYIENKSDRNDRGEAWIGSVEYSKTGQTIYFNNQAFKKIKSGGVSGNFYDLESGDEYWISRVKQNGQDRHWASGGKIKIDSSIIEAYLSKVIFEIIDESNFIVVEIQKTDKLKFNRLENEIL